MNYFEYTSKVGLATSNEVVFFHSVKAITFKDAKILIYSKMKVGTIEMMAPKEVQAKLFADFMLYLKRHETPHYFDSNVIIVLYGLSQMSVSDGRLVLGYEDKDFPVFLEKYTTNELKNIYDGILKLRS